ncbi:hypothetical protein SEA_DANIELLEIGNACE_83 [Arthrobacter phage DanielleIgnace]|nr:hypothetical protein SEA_DANIELLEIGNACE_83 [Arthrobacter phage DanielleIgnace]
MKWSCSDKTHRPYWFVSERRVNFSAFNGYHRTPSDWSRIFCPLCPAQKCTWRTKAKYVDEIPDYEYRTVPSTSKELAVYCEHLSWDGAEDPVHVMGRFPILWTCLGCGRTEAFRELAVRL